MTETTVRLQGVVDARVWRVHGRNECTTMACEIWQTTSRRRGGAGHMVMERSG
jgi:hypothetical protein